MTEPLKINVCLIDINITCVCMYIYTGASLVAQWLKKTHLPMQETGVQSWGWEDPLEKEMATRSRILAWENPMDRGAWQAMVCGAGYGLWGQTEQLILLLYNMHNLKLYAKSYVYVYIELFSHVQLF